MQFEERDHGPYRIYTLATRDTRNGWVAGVVVKLVRGHRGEPECVFINRRLSAGYRFPSAQAALDHAMEVGSYAVELQLQDV